LLALLNNRFILSGLAAVAVLLISAIVLVAIGQENGDTNGSDRPGVVAPPTDGDPTPTRAPGTLSGRVLQTVTLRNGPDSQFAIVGTIPRGALVAVVGRSEDAGWLQVRYPPGSALRGWVISTFLEVEGNVSLLAIAAAGPEPTIEVPGEPTFIFVPPTDVPVETEEPVVTRRPRPTSTRRPASPTPAPTVVEETPPVDSTPLAGQ
jgi:uncharacterized protein YraI